MMGFPIVDLYFAYRDDVPRLCHEVHGLAEDEIDVLLTALKHRFNRTEPDAYTFSIKTADEYSPLERVKRQRGSVWADSGIEGPGQRLMAAIGAEPKTEISDDQRRWLDIRNTAHAMSGEINRLRVELNCHEPVKSSVLSAISVDELVEHLDGIEYTPAKLPPMNSGLKRGADSPKDGEPMLDDGAASVEPLHGDTQFARAARGKIRQDARLDRALRKHTRFVPLSELARRCGMSPEELLQRAANGDVELATRDPDHRPLFLTAKACQKLLQSEHDQLHAKEAGPLYRSPWRWAKRTGRPSPIMPAGDWWVKASTLSVMAGQADDFQAAQHRDDARLSPEGEKVTVREYVDRAIGLLEKAERIRMDAEREAQRLTDSGKGALLQSDPTAVLGSPDELYNAKYQFDAMARPLVQVAYGLDIDAAPLDDFIRTGRAELVAEAIRVLRRIQGEALKREVPALATKPETSTREDAVNTPDAPRAVGAGAAFAAALESDPEAKAAWERVRYRLSAFGQAVQSINTGNRTTIEVVSKWIGEALADMTALHRLDKLDQLASKYPDLAPSIRELQEAWQQVEQADEQRRQEWEERFADIRKGMASLDDWLRPGVPVFDAPSFEDGIQPMGEQIKQAFLDALAEHEERKAKTLPHRTDRAWPYEYGSDLHWLWGWAKRIDRWLMDDGVLPNPHLRGIFRPDRLADRAITRLSDRFPQAFGLVTADLAEVQKRFDEQDGSESLKDELCAAMVRLRDRIWETARLVAEADSDHGEAKQPTVRANWSIEPKGNTDAEGSRANSWWDVQQRLERLRNAGEAYTSQKELAQRLGCSQATVHKAIRTSTKLKAWMAQRRKGAAPAESLSSVITDRKPQATEADPADRLTAEDVDTAMAKLIDEADADERARLNAMDDDERWRMAAAFYEQQQDDEPSPLDDDGKHRAVRQHKRA